MSTIRKRAPCMLWRNLRICNYGAVAPNCVGRSESQSEFIEIQANNDQAEEKHYHNHKGGENALDVFLVRLNMNYGIENVMAFFYVMYPSYTTYCYL
ncbi:hypothetical protein RCL_jg3974.t1 [Rhizophagus clarus]|uniref:Uncharacterized protein n=1 Tax=Rhizophagus clarus TaxID=94130 RepID=A0A8H3KRG4_9GLOM|nr:hypothetical protein RCL_jg3974.t1 [Rhizophagus clarus]